MVDFNTDLLDQAKAALGMAKEAFAPLPGGVSPDAAAGGDAPVDPAMMAGMEADPAAGGAMPPGGLPFPPGMDPAAMQAIAGIAGPTGGAETPISMTVDQLIKLVAAITGKGGQAGGRGLQSRLDRIEEALQSAGLLSAEAQTTAETAEAKGESPAPLGAGVGAGAGSALPSLPKIGSRKSARPVSDTDPAWAIQKLRSFIG